MTTLIIQQDTNQTGNYFLVQGNIDAAKTYTLHNGRHFGRNSNQWVNDYNSTCKKNESKQNPSLTIKGSEIIGR
jgi:hypothetical protein